MKDKIKVIQYGLGPIGLKITRFLTERKNIEITGAVDIDPAKAGKDLGELAGLESKLGFNVTDNALQLLKNSDAVILTTHSSINKIKPQILEILSYGKNIISTCEELVYPWKANPETAAEIDEAAKKSNVSVLSTGVNPGFLMDFLPSAMTAVCRNVKKIRVERIQNALFRRLPFQQKIGAGLTIEQFEQKKNNGTLRHVGLTESIHLIASKLGWKLERTEDIIEPVIADTDVSAGELKIAKGSVLGVKQVGNGYKNGEPIISLIFIAAIGQADPCDRIIINGSPDIDLKIKNGINGDTATCAISVNAVPVIINAKPGLRTMADIEPIAFFE